MTSASAVTFTYAQCRQQMIALGHDLYRYERGRDPRCGVVSSSGLPRLVWGRR